VDQDVGLLEQGVERSAVGVSAQVQRRQALAGTGVQDRRLELGQVRRVDAQHIGAERDQHPGADRSGDDTRQVEHPQAGDRLRRRRGLRPPAQRHH
jgi:hypothetical protein